MLRVIKNKVHFEMQITMRLQLTLTLQVSVVGHLALTGSAPGAICSVYDKPYKLCTNVAGMRKRAVAGIETHVYGIHLPLETVLALW